MNTGGKTGRCRDFIARVFGGDWHMSSLQKVFNLVKILEKRDPTEKESEIIRGEAKVSVGFLIAALSHPNPAVRLRVVCLMAEIRDPRTVDDLSQSFTHDENFIVRDEAGNALACMVNIKAVDALICIMQDDGNIWWAAGKLEMAKPLSLSPLISLLESSQKPYVRSVTIAILQKVSGEDLGTDAESWRKWLEKETSK